jgi:hypothetical protein
LQENELPKINNDFLYRQQWGKSADAVLDAYFLTINAMSSVLTRLENNQINTTEVNNWRKGAIALFYLAKCQKGGDNLQNITPEELNRRISNIQELQKFTDFLFSIKIIRDVVDISLKQKNDPVIEYVNEVYK